MAWDEAEKSVSKATKSGRLNPVVSVKSGKAKRAAEVEADDVEVEEKRHKKKKKGRKEH